MLEEGKLQTVRYTKSKTDEVTTRNVIPLRVPSDNVTTIDVSNLSEEGQTQMEQMVENYNEYFDNHFKTLYNFEDFVEQSVGIRPDVKWRALKKANIEVCDD